LTLCFFSGDKTLYGLQLFVYFGFYRAALNADAV